MRRYISYAIIEDLNSKSVVQLVRREVPIWQDALAGALAGAACGLFYSFIHGSAVHAQASGGLQKLAVDCLCGALFGSAVLVAASTIFDGEEANEVPSQPVSIKTAVRNRQLDTTPISYYGEGRRLDPSIADYSYLDEGRAPLTN